MPDKQDRGSNERNVVSEAKRQIDELLQLHRKHVSETEELSRRIDRIYERIMAGGVLFLPRSPQRQPIAQRGKWRHP